MASIDSDLLKELTSKIEQLNTSVAQLTLNMQEKPGTRKSKKERRSKKSDEEKNKKKKKKPSFIEQLLPSRMGAFYRREYERSPMAARFGIFATAAGSVSKALFRLESQLFSTQRILKTTIGTATSAYIGALAGSITSAFGGIRITKDENIQARAAFTREFGTILTNKSALEFARQAKDTGTTPETRAQASRSFLDTGSRKKSQLVEAKFLKAFDDAGLTMNSALEFAAKNANLIAIAGTKYADELARAAANAKVIGVELKTTEDFADSIVGDFESALINLTELQALGFQIDVNRIMRMAAIGDPEGFRGELISQLSKNIELLDSLQTSRFLKVQIERTFGTSISEIGRLSGRVDTSPALETEPEKTSGFYKGLSETISTSSVVGGIVGALLAVIAARFRIAPFAKLAGTAAPVVAGRGTAAATTRNLSEAQIRAGFGGKAAREAATARGGAAPIATGTAAATTRKLSEAQIRAGFGGKAAREAATAGGGAAPIAPPTSSGRGADADIMLVDKIDRWTRNAMSTTLISTAAIGLAAMFGSTTTAVAAMGGAAAAITVGLYALAKRFDPKLLGGKVFHGLLVTILTATATKAVDLIFSGLDINKNFVYDAIQASIAGAGLGFMVGGPKGALIGGLIGGVGSLAISGIGATIGSGMAAGGLVKGPGSSTGDNILTPLSNGEYVINARATNSYGTDFLDSINSRSYGGMSDRQDSVNDKFETLSNSIIEINSKLPNMIADAMRGIKVEMDGNSVGRIVSNSFTPIERYSTL